MKEAEHTRRATENLRFIRSNVDGLVERRGKRP